MDALKVGVIGIGNIGLAHAGCIRRGDIRGMELAAVCDCDPVRKAVAEDVLPGIPFFGTAEALMDSGVEAVVIAVPHPSHGDLAIRAFQKGLHVLVEKPMDITVSKARQINAAAEQSGKTFGIMFNQRTGFLFQKARELVQSGQLGQLKRSTWIVTNWYRTQHYYDSGTWRATWLGEGGGVLMNQAPHQLDLWQWICGMPESVTAFCDEGKHHAIEVEDEATLHVRFPGGATGVFITSTGEYPGTNRLEICGTKGKLVLESGMLKWWQLERDERSVCRASEKSFEKIPMTCREFRQEKESSGHCAILQNFADAVLCGTPMIAPGSEGIRELMLQNGAYLSAWKGSVPVKLPFEEAEFDRFLQEKQNASRLGSGKTSQKRNTDYSERWKINW